MKFIISESKLSSLGFEKKSDILYKLIQIRYPDLYEDETENRPDLKWEIVNF